MCLSTRFKSAFWRRIYQHTTYSLTYITLTKYYGSISVAWKMVIRRHLVWVLLKWYASTTLNPFSAEVGTGQQDQYRGGWCFFHHIQYQRVNHGWPSTQPGTCTQPYPIVHTAVPPLFTQPCPGRTMSTAVCIYVAGLCASCPAV